MDSVKVKCTNEQEFVVAEYTKSDMVAPPLVAGPRAERSRQAADAGHVGTGFTHAELGRLRAMMKPLERATPPLAGTVPADVRRCAVWVEPRLVVQVAFAEMTSDGMARHPSYRGIREDKPPDSVHRERPAPPVATKTTRSPAERRRKS
jgi:bifunctional non-homologous end joining protein LigD